MSEIRATTISDAAGTGPITLTGQSAAKVWAQVADNSGTPSISQSFGLSSITDTANGNLASNFISAMNYSNYHHAVDNQFRTTGSTTAYFAQPSTSSNTTTYAVNNHYEGGTLTYPYAWNISVHGDLA